MQTPPSHVPPLERLHALDALRGFSLLLGVALHAAMSFLPGPQLWLVADLQRAPVFGLVFFVIHQFRMLGFFLIAGFFARMSLQRLGAKAFVWDRLKRIGIPLVVAWPLTLSAITGLLLWNLWLAGGGHLPAELPASAPISLEAFPLAHLWFLYVLLIFYAVAIGLRQLLPRVAAQREAIDACVRLVVARGGIVLVAAPMAVALYFTPNWLWWFGVPTPDSSLKPNLTALVSYGSAFAFGWFLQRQVILLQRLERLWPAYLALALVTTALALNLVGGFTPNLSLAPRDATTLGYAAAYSLGAWSWSFALLGLASHYMKSWSAVRRYIADASYWIYLVHLPLVMAAQTLVARLEWSWAIKYPLVVSLTLLVSISSYQLFVRYTFIGVILNGRRMRPVTQRRKGRDTPESAPS